MRALSVLILISLMFSFVSPAEYQLKKASELQVGDIIIDSDGNEIVVKKIVGSGKVQENYTYEKSDSLMDVFWNKIKKDSLPEPVISGGSSEKGLSLGEYGVGKKIFEGEVSLLNESSKTTKTKSSFLSKLLFWRNK